MSCDSNDNCIPGIFAQCVPFFHFSHILTTKITTSILKHKIITYKNTSCLLIQLTSMLLLKHSNVSFCVLCVLRKQKENKKYVLRFTETVLNYACHDFVHVRSEEKQPSITFNILVYFTLDVNDPCDAIIIISLYSLYLKCRHIE